MTSREADIAPDGAYRDLLELVVLIIEGAGVTVIVVGVIWAAYVFVTDAASTQRAALAYKRLRSNLGRGILLGLELLVGADIIATVTAPLTLQSVGLLGLVVLIRTFLSFSLETEIEGRFPWRRHARHGDAGK